MGLAELTLSRGNVFASFVKLWHADRSASQARHEDTHMKGRTLQQIAQELNFIKENSRDVIAHPGHLEMNNNCNLVLHGLGNAPVISKPTSWAYSQIASFLNIPKDYADRMREETPELYARNVNTWLERQGPKERRMLRMVGDKLRAFLSNSYKILDSYDLMNTVYPIIKKNNMEVISCELTERRLYVKATHPNMRGEVMPGDSVTGGVVISTSDVGSGMALIEPYAWRQVCTNGLIAETKLGQRHLGKRQGATDNIGAELLSQKTVKLEAEAFFSKVKDVLIDALKPETFEQHVNTFRVAAGRPITQQNLPHVIELATKGTSITGKELKTDIVKQLLTGNEGAGLTQWGLANSFTAMAKRDDIDYDTSVELERAGGRIVALDKDSWAALAQA